MKALAASLILTIAALSATAASAQRARPVIVRQDPELDACPSTGQASGLNPYRDNYLSVRAGPSAAARELARVGPGQILWICDASASADWYGVVYSMNPNRRCGLGAIRRTQAYRGPCPSGWVARRYVTVIAG